MDTMEGGVWGLSFRSQSSRSMAMHTSMPFSTRPNTVCLLSRRGMGTCRVQVQQKEELQEEGEGGTVVMKNCEPLVLG
jgi:hypothetical protein